MVKNLMSEGGFPATASDSSKMQRRGSAPVVGQAAHTPHTADFAQTSVKVRSPTQTNTHKQTNKQTRTITSIDVEG
jgi:hypothetical protein